MLKIEKIKKSFGKHTVVNDVSFTVNKGEAFGLLGPNGAGKSTVISMICGQLFLMKKGEILVGGESVKDKPMAIKQKIGIVPQDIALYPTLSALDNLVFWGRMYGLPSKIAKKRAYEVLEFVGLSERSRDKIETFSGGMKRRINIGAALLHEPELLIMDEPTVGIDPQSRNHILETVKELNEAGKTIIYTSHYMEEVEFLCNRIGIIDHGEVLALGTKEELYEMLDGGTVIELEVSEMNDRILEKIKQLTFVKGLDIKENSLHVFVTESNQSIGHLVSEIITENIQVNSVQVKKPNLEAVFLQLTGRSLRD